MKKFLKQFGGIVLGTLILGGSLFAAVVQWNNSKLELSQKRMLFTDTGLTTGVKIADINSGGKIIMYGELLDGSGNTFITGFTESDPIWSGDKADYVPYSGASASLNLGNNSLYSNNVYGVMGSMGLIFQDSPVTARAMIGAITNGTFYLANLQSTGVILDVQKLTQDRAISFPDATGTIVLDNTLNTMLGGYVPMSATGNWNTAYGRGNHASGGYLTGISITTTGTNGYFPLVIGNSLIRSTYFQVTGTNDIVMGNFGWTDRDASDHDNVFIGGLSNTVKYNGINSAVLIGGESNYLNSNNDYSAIIGGKDLHMSSASYSVMIGGISNDMNVNGAGPVAFAAMLGGNTNVMNGYNQTSFLGGGTSCYMGENSKYAAMIGGYSNTIGVNSNSTAIVAGSGNILSGSSNFSVILGGENNTIFGSNSYALGSNVRNNVPNSFVYNNTGTYTNAITGAYIVNTYGGAYFGGGLFNISGSPYISLDSATTGAWTYPGSTGKVVTESAVSAQLNALAADLGDVMTTGSYLITATGTVNNGSWRMVISGGNLSFQAYTGGAWVEKGFFSM